MNQFMCKLENCGVIQVGELFRVGPRLYVCDRFEILNETDVLVTGHALVWEA